MLYLKIRMRLFGISKVITKEVFFDLIVFIRIVHTILSYSHCTHLYSLYLGSNRPFTMNRQEPLSPVYDQLLPTLP